MQKAESSFTYGLELKQITPNDALIVGWLIRLLLSFLAGPSTVEAEERHKAVQCLLNVTVFETSKLATLNYSLYLSYGKILNVRPSPMIRRDWESSNLYTVKIDRTTIKRFYLNMLHLSLKK
ncbi:hypothetical protein SLEP1_g22640 [Rubroshorea leprosula]|uniref:LAGLIDADG homing endonuclease n=1 Tax=Rubroshorea leprosula TaxID=152421 RepID=A0AAV5JF59_9ROSI|nr:hypothetical protein SLEP1_g22640 [Rubroshorea leprosula]